MLLKQKILIALLLSTNALWAQVLRIEDCYENARQNYPLIKQKELIAKSSTFSVDNVRSGLLPQISINGQATYQSAVTQVPIESPMFKVDPLSKDQYKVYAELNQSIYDGGSTKRNTTLQETSAKLEDQKVEIELYKIKDRINQLYFGILLINEQLAQIDLVKKDIQSSLEKIQSAIKNGTAFRMNADILEAELLKNDQRAVELKSARRSYFEMLGMFIYESLSENTQLQKPEAPVVQADPMINRPEISLYKYQSELYTAQHEVTATKITPRLGFFVQGGYGRPALNMLKNDFEGYYIGGLRFNWNLGGLYNTHRDKQILSLNLESVNKQKETFEFNTQLQLKQQNNEMKKLVDLIDLDQKLIELRIRVKNTAKAQLDNGVITANDYLRELNAEDQAKQNLSVHQIQLLMTQYNYQVTSGN